MELTVKEIQAWLTDFTEKIDENKSYLSELDTPIGDGDHGNNMGRFKKNNRKRSVTRSRFFRWQ